MTIPVFDRTLPALAEAVNHAAQVLRNIRDTGGDLSWRITHHERERALIQAQVATQALLFQMVELENGQPRIVDGNYVPIPANVAVVTDKLAGYPGTPADGMALLVQFGVVDAAAKAFNSAYVTWHDSLPLDHFFEWDTSGGYLNRREVHALTEAQAAPLRAMPELNALIEAFEAVGG